MEGLEIPGYVCGALCSGGTIVWKEHRSNYCIILETKDGDFAKMFHECLTQCSLKAPVISQHQRPYKARVRNASIVRLCGRNSVSALVNKWGLRAGRHEWAAPEMAFKDSAFRKGFLRGFFDGSGTIHARVFREHGTGKMKKRRSIRVSSVNKKGTEQIKILLKEEAISSLIYHAGKVVVLEIHGKANMQQFEKIIGFSAAGKKALFKETLMPISLGWA